MQKLKAVVMGLTCILGLSGTVSVYAQVTPESTMEHLEALAQRGKLLQQSLGKNADHLSSGGRMLITLGERWDNRIKPMLKIALEQRGAATHEELEEIGGVFVPVKKGNDINETEDFVTRSAGSTQSETTVAWWNKNAVCGFNDSGSFVATALPGSPSPSGSLSFTGWSLSTNAHTGSPTFTDKGALISDPIPAGSKFVDLFGDPVVKATSKDRFYFTNLAMDTKTSSAQFSGIAISTNVGSTWGGAVMAVEKDATKDFLDKEWMAVVPGTSPNTDKIYITYTDFGSTGTTTIEFVKSTDGGVTWSAPVVLDTGTGTKSLQGSQVAVGTAGEIFVAWEVFDAPDTTTRSIKFSKSTDGGSTFSAPVVVSSVTPVGNGEWLQGVFRTLELQGLVVDTSTKKTRGNIYISWYDGRNLDQDDVVSLDGKYHFADILVSKSTDKGATWSAPVRVNNDPIKNKVDQFMPAIAVDKRGRIAVLFYDRRNDKRNYLIDVFSAVSVNGGNTWLPNQKRTTKSFAPITGWNDIVVNPFYMGDYIALTSDASQTKVGYIAAWGDNALGDANVNTEWFQ